MVSCSLTTLFFSVLFFLIIVFKWLMSNKLIFIVIVIVIIAKRSIQHYLKPLTYLINKSIHQGIFPDELKIAKVFPVFKSGDKTNISNYKPISVLLFFSKVFEKLYITMLLISLILIVYYPNSNLAFEKIIVQIMRS